MLPPDSFVTNFTMKIAEKIIVGQVEEKVKAEKIFDKASFAQLSKVFLKFAVEQINSSCLTFKGTNYSRI